MRFRCAAPEATRAAAITLSVAVGAAEATGLTLALIGPLGAGKTVFVKGLAEGLGLDPAGVASPTFVIASEYIGRGGARLAHVDLYRLETARELDEVGFADLFEPGAVVAVEWADRLPDALPPDRLELRIERAAGDPDSRSFAASATGEGSQRVLAAWEAGLREAGEVEWPS